MPNNTGVDIAKELEKEIETQGLRKREQYRERYEKFKREKEKEKGKEKDKGLTKTDIINIVTEIEGNEDIRGCIDKRLTKIFNYFKIDKIKVTSLYDEPVKKETIFETHIGEKEIWLKNPILKELFIQCNSVIDNRESNTRYHLSYNTSAFLVMCLLYNKELSCLFSNKYIDGDKFYRIGEDVPLDNIENLFEETIQKEINEGLVINTIFLLTDAHIADFEKVNKNMHGLSSGEIIDKYFEDYDSYID